MRKSIVIHQNSNRVRKILLFSTIVLFVIISLVFLISIQQYKNIQKRLENIYLSINEENSDFSDILTKYNEAENYFRLFSIDFDIESYSKYEQKLLEINGAIDSMLVSSNRDTNSSKSYNDNIGKRKVIADDFVLLRLRISEILNYSDTLKQYPQMLSESEIFNVLTVPHSESIKNNKAKEFIVVKKKPFFKRIFDSKNDTISLQNLVTNEDRQKEIKLQKQLNINAANSRNKLATLKKSFFDLRQKERELLSTNFSLLYDLNKIIRDIHENQVVQKHLNSSNETKTLFERTNQFKWTMISCLFFMFIMICMIIYYQLYSNYYERKLIEEKLYANKLAEEKTDTIAEITHEIRTPINSLIGIIDLLKKKENLYTDKDKLLLESAYSSIQNTSKTINDILNLSKVDDSSNNLLLSNFDINDLLMDVVEQNRNQAELKNLQIKYVKEKGLRTIVYSDEFKIRHILNNLLSNSIKYSQKGTIISSVMIDNKSSQLILTVEDQGIGISADLEKTIFRKYFTVNKNNKVEGGVGLGLFILQKLVNSLNGKISFTSQSNVGTTFTITIPIPPAKQPKPGDTEKVTSVTELRKDISWLIVDDNALNLLYMKHFFALHPHVETATNGAEALEVLQKKKIDIIITDINMPIMTGDEVLMHIRKNPKYNDILVIATSSDNEQVKSLEIKHNICFNGILVKPFNEKKLIEVISNTLNSCQKTPQ
ncbi:hybrid sensor histidine kinase/response regulator [Sphingobacterium spiritivorum]|nr:ATP-binding protein [Sphingobacterium spiritivorum]QQS96998.1 response regulator [Sphingobacterium spiritivorum]